MYKRYCPKCGNEIDYNVDKCMNCGTTVEKLEYIKTDATANIKPVGF